jgi:hypothetical protein
MVYVRQDAANKADGYIARLGEKIGMEEAATGSCEEYASCHVVDA